MTPMNMTVEQLKGNFAFIDGTNLKLTMNNIGWTLDLKKFRIYLKDKFGVTMAYYFIGFVPTLNDLYTALQSYGYVLVFKPTLRLPDGKIKGNCDAEMVLQAMIDLQNYNKAVIITSDGDFGCLVKYLRKVGKLERVIAPCLAGSSTLLRAAAGSQIDFLDNLRMKLEYIQPK
jgi:uncharacterized LabA/DUF88 family protein